MAHYRLYLLDDTGHIREGMDLDCANDDAAMAIASAYVDRCAVEVWQQTRRVAHLPERNLTTGRTVDTQRVGRRTWGRARQPLPPELDQAERQVAEARRRVEGQGKLVEAEMRRGNPTLAARELLASCQAMLRELMVKRDAIFGAFMKTKPEPPADAIEPPNSRKNTRD